MIRAFAGLCVSLATMAITTVILIVAGNFAIQLLQWICAE